MSIASKLTKLAADIGNAYDSIESKNGTIPQNKNTENLSYAISSINTGSSVNIFIQNTQPEGYNGIWVADENATSNVVEVPDMNSLIPNSLNILKGSIYSTSLFDGYTYSFNMLCITNNDAETIDNVPIYYGDGTQWIRFKLYTKYDYIQSDGIAYINTGIKVSSTDYMILEFTNDAISNSYARIFGIGYYFIQSDNWSLTQYMLKYGGGSNAYDVIYFDPRTIFSMKATFSDGKLYDLGSNQVIANNTRGIDFSQPLFLWNDLTLDRVGRMKFRRLKIYNSSNQLKYDIIPVKDNNEIACLFDKINVKFFYNSGGGSFTAGNDQ